MQNDYACSRMKLIGSFGSNSSFQVVVVHYHNITDILQMASLNEARVLSICGLPIHTKIGDQSNLSMVPLDTLELEDDYSKDKMLVMLGQRVQEIISGSAGAGEY